MKQNTNNSVVMPLLRYPPHIRYQRYIYSISKAFNVNLVLPILKSNKLLNADLVSATRYFSLLTKNIYYIRLRSLSAGYIFNIMIFFFFGFFGLSIQSIFFSSSLKFWVSPYHAHVPPTDVLLYKPTST